MQESKQIRVTLAEGALTRPTEGTRAAVADRFARVRQSADAAGKGSCPWTGWES